MVKTRWIFGPSGFFYNLAKPKVLLFNNPMIQLPSCDTFEIIISFVVLLFKWHLHIVYCPTSVVPFKLVARSLVCCFWYFTLLLVFLFFLLLPINTRLVLPCIRPWFLFNCPIVPMQRVLRWENPDMKENVRSLMLQHTNEAVKTHSIAKRSLPTSNNAWDERDRKSKVQLSPCMSN